MALVKLAPMQVVPARGWIRVPPSGGRVRWASIALDPTARGEAMRALYRIPPIFVRIAFDDGALASYRLMPDNARNGVPVDLLPLSREEFALAFVAQPARAAVAIALDGPGIEYYRTPVPITWLVAAEGNGVR